LVRLLLAQNPRSILIVDNMLSADPVNVPDDPAVHLVVGSITDDGILAALPRDLDYAFHLACYHGNQSSIHDPLADHDNNTLTSLKLFDRLIQDKVRPGFEMLIDNFSIGILGGIMAIFGYKVIEPVVGWITDRLGDGVETLVNHSLLPLSSVIIEPAKVLFLNNAINHGVLTPLGAAEVQEQGKSILFMLEANPGPGAGLLLAYFFFGPRSLRPTVPAALIIQFFGGIHEIYFPYVLMRPRTVLATIAGGASGIAVFQAFGVGLTGPAAPGSFIAFMGVTAKGDYPGVILGIAVSAVVSFFVTAALFGFGRNSDDIGGQTDIEMTKAEEAAAANKGRPITTTSGTVSAPVANRNEPQEA
jgi:PTS system mannitol-specific IIC component